VPTSEVPAGLAWQALWLVIGIGTFRLIWERGIRRFSAVGA
jgi:ABC-type uncharacterized transport system permease subunit